MTTVPKPPTTNARSIDSRGTPVASNRDGVLVEQPIDRGAQRFEAGAGTRRYLDHLGILEHRTGEAAAKVLTYQRQPVGVHQVGLGKHKQPVAQLKQIENMQMLLGLGHAAFVGGDNKEGSVDPADAGQHIFDEALVTGHINDAHLPPTGQPQVRKAQIDRHLAALLFGKAIRIDAGKRKHQRRFAVVNVAGGT